MISSGAHCAAVPLGMSKAGRLGPAPPAGNPGTHPHLPPATPFCRSKPSKTFSSWWSEGEPSPRFPQQRWIVKIRKKKKHGSFKIRSNEREKRWRITAWKIWKHLNQDAWTLPQHRNSRAAKYMVGPIVWAVGCLEGLFERLKNSDTCSTECQTRNQSNKIQNWWQIDGQ